MDNDTSDFGNPEDKTLEYYIIKILHYQNQLTYYLYLNNKRSGIQRRNLNFLKATEVPALIIVILNVYFLITNPQFGLWLFLIIIAATLIIPSLIYLFYTRNINKKDEYVMEFTEFLINVEYLMEQIDLIKNFNISKDLVDSIEHKVGIIEYYLLKKLKKIWDVKIKDLSKKGFENFLDELNYDVVEFHLRLIQILDRLKYKYKDIEQLKKTDSYKILNEVKTHLENEFNLRSESDKNGG